MTKIFCDIADINLIKKFDRKKIVKGFTTNPSLMRKAGAKDYQNYSKKILGATKKPISFEVFADNHDEMIKQGKKISKWGKNVFVKVPYSNTKGKFSGKVIKVLNSQKIKFEGKKATGVSYYQKEKVITVKAGKEVILSAGSIGSPHILQVSGIGDSEKLKKHGIETVHELKGVGKNLQDHLETYIMQECKTPDTLYTYTKLIPKVMAGIKWFLSKSGPCSKSFLEAGGFAKSSPEREIANIQFHFFPSFVIDHGLVNPSSHGYQLHASPNHPKSRGLIALNSSDPYDYPKILFNYLEDEDDLKQTRECIHVARKILAQPSLAKHSGKEVGPGSDKKSDEELNEYIRSKAETAYHPCGTCKMGIDDMAVVDENLKVKGMQNLRVVDASVMPEIPSANLNAPTLMIAEKASELILNTN